MSSKPIRWVLPATPRRVTVLAVGSLGDVRPMLALGAGLQASGHEVTVATHGIFEADVRALGLGFSLIPVNPQSVLESEEGMAWLSSQANPLKSARTMAALIRPIFRQVLDDSWKACQGAEALVCSTLALWGHDIALSMQIPYAFAPLYPMRRTRFLPAIGAAPLPLGGAYNLLTHLLYQQLSWQPFRDIANDWRTSDLGLPPAPAWAGERIMGWPGVPIVYAYSSAVIPRPRDWEDNQYVTGYWFPDQRPAAAVDPAVADFVDSGPPPVYIGFGSMTDPEPARLADILLETVRLTGQRAVLLSGWAKIPDPGDDNVMVVESVPHEWLFPRVAAVVHHGGAGTTAGALRAGAPSVVVPYFLDHTLWGHQVARLGAGPRPIPRTKLTAQRLAGALRQAEGDPRYRAAAERISRQIRAEDGVAAAVGILNNYLDNVPRKVGTRA